ncbi:MAG TPA: DUF4097 family beta strand repeat-containing protein [Candidatus Limnocylindrales bacterium]|nr:DUF4097 family beta strand repeat-containing protein [Candidatus Limnocylindrales bacterium]
MRVRRGLLFWGLLLIPLGAIPLLVRAGTIDESRIADAWRFWPLIVIGLGLVVLLGRTRWALIGTTVIALTMGSIGGAALASGNVWLGAIAACGATGNDAQQLDRTGTFTGAAAIRLDLNCGSVSLRATDAGAWSFHAGYRGPAPSVDAADNHLDIRTPSGSGRRQDWTLAVPADAIGSIDLTANAGASTVDAASARLGDVNVTVNAGDLRVAAGSASIRNLDLTMNAGRARITLGGATTGTIAVNAGAVDLCVPADAGLRLDVEDQLTFATNLSSRGLSRDGNVWTRAQGNLNDLITLSVQGNAASFNLDPNGGC